MKAVTWLGDAMSPSEDVPDPRIECPTDAIVKVTSFRIHSNPDQRCPAGPAPSP